MLEADLTTRELARLGDPTKLMDREWAPCRYNCPVHADVRLYIEQVAQGRFKDAIDTIRRNLPLAAVCGRICHHPCEANCRRKDVDAAVAIREVKRFVAETQGASGSTVNKAVAQDKARVAIVGGGPAGLAAALDLAKLGYRPTIFEKFPVAGGIPATAIPKYRMPRDVLQIDVDWIAAHGVQIVTGVEIGKDKTLTELEREFQAVLLAAGLAKSRPLPMPGSDHQRVLGVLDFLQAVAFDKPVDIGQDVLVIGGGNVAVDAARTAARLGAGRVRMMCLESLEEMPAWEWERREANEEGISFINRRGPVEVVTRGGGIVSVRARQVTRVFDEQRRFNPAYNDADVIDIACDTVIIAIGQLTDTGFAAGSALKLDARGRLEFNPRTHQTNLPNVFACGEVVAPPGSAVEACASGQRAAQAIHQYLSGQAILVEVALPPAIGTIAAPTAEKVTKVTRTDVPTEPGAARRKTFAQFDHTYVELAALREARRCMGCGGGAEVLVDKCAACQTCARVCPFDIPKVANTAYIDPALCQACGTCVAECPANAIIFRSRSVDQLVNRTKAMLAGTGHKVVAYICGQRADSADWRGLAQDVPGVGEIYVTSMASIRVADLLRAFEDGADTVLVIASQDGQDRYPKTNQRIRARVDQARGLLQEAGIPGAKLRYFELA